MYIINSGGWYVGNSAIIDWLSKIDGIGYIHGDLNVFRLEDGIMDMLSEKDLLKKRIMIRKNKKACFKGNAFALKSVFKKLLGGSLESLNNLEYYYRAKYYYFYYVALSNYEKKLGIDTFNEKQYWVAWLHELSFLFSTNFENSRKYTVLQNPFFYDETYDGHKNVWPELFKPYKLIFVHRDPLDQLSDIVETGALFDSSWARFHGDTSSLEPFDRFFEISKKLYNGRLRLLETHNRKNSLVLAFEDFILNHEVTASNLFEFLGLPSQTVCWDPAPSKKNIGKGKEDSKVQQLISGKEHMIDELMVLRDKLIKISLKS